MTFLRGVVPAVKTLTPLPAILSRQGPCRPSHRAALGADSTEALKSSLPSFYAHLGSEVVHLMPCAKSAVSNSFAITLPVPEVRDAS